MSYKSFPSKNLASKTGFLVEGVGEGGGWVGGWVVIKGEKGELKLA